MARQGFTRQLEILDMITATQIRDIRGDDPQPVFAKRLRCTVVTVSRWENDHRIPSPVYEDKLRRLARSKGIAI